MVAVRRFEHFDLDKNIQDLLQLASELYETPVAFLTLIHEHEQWFLAGHGYEVDRMPRDTSFCTHVVQQEDVMVVPDAHADGRFLDNPLVRAQPHIRFYAGAPLATHDGLNIGTLCVMDVRTKTISDTRRHHLSILARQAMYLMELKLAYELLNEKIQQVQVQNKALMDIAFIQSHEFRGPLTSVMGMMNLIKEEGIGEEGAHLLLMEEAVLKLDAKIHRVVESTEVAHRAFVAK